MSDQSKTLPAGWYPDINMVGTQRYFDGAEWTAQVAPLGEAPAPTKDDWDGDRPIIVGFLLTVFIPFIGAVGGLAIGIKLLARRRFASGIAMMIWSAIVLFVLILFIASS